MTETIWALVASIALNVTVLLLPAQAAVAQGQSGPNDVIRRVIELTDARQLPNWTDSSFDGAVAPFLTEKFRSAIRHGKSLAGRFDILDGDPFLAGRQSITHVKIDGMPMGAVHGDLAVLVTPLSMSDASGPVDAGVGVTYWLKKEGGAWKIDDIRQAEGTLNDAPTLKQLLGSPEKYLPPIPLDAAAAPGAEVGSHSTKQATIDGQLQLPLKYGIYSEAHASCDPGGNFSAYNAQLSFRGRTLNNSVTLRDIAGLNKTGNVYTAHLNTMQRDSPYEGGPPEQVIWKIVVFDLEHFQIVGMDHGKDWSGLYRWCKALAK